MMMKNSLCIPLLLLLLMLHSNGTAQSEPDFAFSSCGNDEYTNGSTYDHNLKSILNSLTLVPGNPVVPGFYNFSSGGRALDRVNGLGHCWGNTGDDCRGCITNATSQILKACPNKKEADGFYENCLIRYTNNRPIFGILDPKSPLMSSTWNGRRNNASRPTLLNATIYTLLTQLQTIVRTKNSGRKYAQGWLPQGSLRIYGLLQCSPDLSTQLCEDCVNNSILGLTNCCTDLNQFLTPYCYLRFETYRFYPGPDSTLRPAVPPPPPPIERDGGSIVGAIIFAIICVIIIGIPTSLCIICTLHIKKTIKSRIAKQRLLQNETSKQQNLEQCKAAQGISNNGALQFGFEMIRTATNDFAYENKLGQGGFGAVYKGALSNGQDIAVKRLAKDSGQGDLEFENEVKLVAKLQHRNLVRLLGHSLEGTERLLIYEFMPNASLDHFLFGKRERRTHLDWERRSKIIRGIARGVLYLHEDSRLRIIHRDLKTSNILLDAEMNPKIADFGMARLFHMDETEGNTNRIVGTYGYMAPEYAMHGEFSVKSDVFSFGVILLEIVSGQKNNLFRHSSSKGDLLSHAWKNWISGTYSNVIDTSLGSVSGNEIARYIHIGLLSVQDNVNDRPTMASAALMLTGNSISLQLPLKPAFFMYTEEEQSNRGTNHAVLAESDQSSGQSIVWSINEASVTDIYPR